MTSPGADEERTDHECPHCGASITAAPRTVARHDLERSGCTTCGLQVVRRTGEPWRGIRG